MGVLSDNVIIGASAAGDYTIDQSLRCNDDDSAYLSRTPASAGNRKTWTFNIPIKRGNLGSTQDILIAGSNAASQLSFQLSFNSNNGITIYATVSGSAADIHLVTDAVFRDPAGWYFINLKVDTTQATASDRVVLEVNGEQITSFSTETYPAQNYDTAVNNTVQHTIGRFTNVAANYFDGLFGGEVRLTDGVANASTAFGETDDTYGHWKPKKYTGTYGTNGFYLDFADSGDIGNDVSGNNNDWTPTNLAATDVVLDSPTLNFATFSPLHGGNGTTLSEGNLYVTNPDNKSNGTTWALNSGKWVAEAVVDSANYVSVGVCRHDESFGTNLNGSSEAYMYAYSGNAYKAGTTDTNPATFTTGDIITLYLDLDNNKLYIYKNNSGITTSEGTHVVGTTGISITSGYSYYFCTTANGNNALSVWNFGQDSSFAGNKTAQGNTDGNGYGDFYYAPPSGYLALCTANLPDPAVVPSEHFNTVLYSGTGASNAITGVGFGPDSVWIKRRNTAASHKWFSELLTTGYALETDSTGAENDMSAFWTSFDADGFTITGTNGAVNGSSDTYAAWCWKANGSGSSNTDGSITSTVSANTAAGFSIVSYTGNATQAATVGHGLDSAPEIIIMKNRDAANGWVVGATPADSTWNQHMYLHLTNALINDGMFADTPPTTTIFSLKNDGDQNANAQDYIAYCFHSVEGYSKVFSFAGNENADGNFIHLGFLAEYVLLKTYGQTGDWWVWDIVRDTLNPLDSGLKPNSAAAESTPYTAAMDVVSNGIKIREGASDINRSTGIIGYAVAKLPFKYSNAR